MNELATDLQMFALKTLKIQLPRQHPPSPSPSPSPNLPNGHTKLGDNSTEWRPANPCQSGPREPLLSSRMKAPQQNVSPAMSILQKYYGLQSSNSIATPETELAVYTPASSDHSRDEWLPRASTIFGFPSNQNPKSTNSVYDLWLVMNSIAKDKV